jgi:hypothetical protein
VDQFCNYTYAWLWDRTPPDKKEQFEYELNLPAPGEKRSESVNEETVEAENAAFFALAGLAAEDGAV